MELGNLIATSDEQKLNWYHVPGNLLTYKSACSTPEIKNKNMLSIQVSKRCIHTTITYYIIVYTSFLDTLYFQLYTQHHFQLHFSAVYIHPGLFIFNWFHISVTAIKQDKFSMIYLLHSFLAPCYLGLKVHSMLHTESRILSESSLIRRCNSKPSLRKIKWD